MLTYSHNLTLRPQFFSDHCCAYQRRCQHRVMLVEEGRTDQCNYDKKKVQHRVHLSMNWKMKRRSTASGKCHLVRHREREVAHQYTRPRQGHEHMRIRRDTTAIGDGQRSKIFVKKCCFRAGSTREVVARARLQSGRKRALFG